MIPRDLLLSNGTIDALETLLDDGARTTDELTDAMDLSDSTVRRRMTELSDVDLVELDAEIRDGHPVRVYRLTDLGYDATNRLLILIGEGVSETVQSDDTTDADESPDAEQNALSDDTDMTENDDIKPSGVTFGGTDE